MAKSIKLNISQDIEFLLIGIVTSEPIYRVAWLINNLLNIQLKESPESIQFYNKQKVFTQNFIKFSYLTENEDYFYLFQNKGEQGILIEEQKQVDYWIIINDMSIFNVDLVKKIKSLDNINLAFQINPNTLKSRTKLIF
jgi:hypothetical protein